MLVALNVGLLLLAVAGVAGVAGRLLVQLADEQTRAALTQGSLSIRQEVRSAATSLLTAAQVLAERPTLDRLVREQRQAELASFLDQYRQTSRLGGCAVLQAGQVLASSGAAYDWQALGAQVSTSAVILDQPASGQLLLVATARAPQPGTQIVTAWPLDSSFTHELGAQFGLAVALYARQAPLAAPVAALREQAFTTNAPVAARLAGAQYVALLPLQLANEPPVAVLEVSLPATRVDQTLRELGQTLLLLTLVVALLAGVASFVLGRWLGRPLDRLAAAAVGIGRGDLATPVLPAPGAEAGTLASALEEMRGRLLQLTGDLQRQQAEAQAIVSGIVEGVFTVDRQRRVGYINPQAAALLGVAPEVALGRFCGDLLNPQAPGGRPCENDCPLLRARFQNGARATEHLLLANGQRRTVVITSATPDAGRQVVVMRDETELEAVRRLRDAVLANISHEFRTPLSAQLASIELLLDRLPELTTDQVGQLIRALQRGTLRLTRLIDNLLESVRIESGQDDIRRRPVALDEVVEEAVELTRPLLSQRRQEVGLELPYPLPSIVGDGPRLTQVLVNLLANANKFAPIGSTIQVGGVVHDDAVVLWVRDRGEGLPPAPGANLFERFVRAAGQEPEQSGMGLGLWIVKSIVERHGGSVGAHSSPEGTQFYIVLPRTEEWRDEDPSR